ncbi:hypothetical protein [Methanobrevibacter sp.]|uniref:hypothetical protein n=1 Tax=Methanobrevibacter sp. TaxID=66852 RepID=UPI00388E24B9
MKKISLITISLLIFVFAISCASAADHNVDMTNNTDIGNTIDIANVQNVDFNISAEDNSSLNIEPLENNTNTPSELNITGPKIHSGELNITGPKPHDFEIPGPKIQVNSDYEAHNNGGEMFVGITTSVIAVVTANPPLLIVSIGILFDWW